MQSTDFIAAREFCSFYHAELSFIEGLHESGLIGVMIRDGATWVSTEELPRLEKFVRWHYELAINFEGIEALAHLLDRMSSLQEENKTLRNRLQQYTGRQDGPVQPAEEI